MFKSLFKPHNLYLALWFAYSLQGTLYASGTIISQLILVIALLSSSYHIFKVNTTFRIPSFLKVVNIFLLVLTLYGTIYMIASPRDSVFMYGQGNKIDYLKQLYISLFPIYSFYYFSKRGVISEKWIRGVVIFLLGVALLNFFNYKEVALEKMAESGWSAEEITNNTGYSFCNLLPLLFFFRKKPTIQYILLLVCVGFVVVAMKRGAIIVAACIIVYFLYKSLSVASKRQRIAVILLSLIAMIVGSYFVMDFFASSAYFQHRLNETMEGNSSGRDVAFALLLDYWLNKTTALQFLFGSGANYSVEIWGNYAHNDWLELATGQGLFGVILYIFYFVCLRKDISRLKHNSNPDYFVVMNMVFITIFLATLFSMSYASMSLSTKVALGYCLGQLSYPAKKESYPSAVAA